MKKKTKIDLVMSGVLRTAASVSILAGLRHINPESFMVGLMGSYAWLSYGMEHTANKILTKEELENDDDKYFDDNLKENFYECNETKIINKVFEVADKTTEFIKKCK